MPVYKSPGVYIEEISAGPKPIAGVSTSTAAFIGSTQQGPQNEPTRLTSWPEYVRTFGGYIDNSYTAESVFAFFENGGEACFVVRADASETGTWQVKDAAGADSFVIKANSPGDWSGGVDLSLTRRVAAGRASLFSAKLKDDARLNTDKTINVSSTAGAVPGMKVELKKFDGATVTATLQSVGDETLTLGALNPAAPGTFEKAGTRVYAKDVFRDDTRLVLGKSAGIEVGDAVLLRVPSETPPNNTAVPPKKSWRTTTVTGVATEGENSVIEIDSAFKTNLTGLTHRRRRVKYDVNLPGPETEFTAAGLNWKGTKLEPGELKPGDYLTASNGVEGPWVTNKFVMPDSVPAGAGTVKAGLLVLPFEEIVEIVPPVAEKLKSLYGYLPAGAKLSLTKKGPGAKVNVAWDGTHFAVTPAPAAGAADPLDADFESVALLLDAEALSKLDDKDRGLVVQSDHAPRKEEDSVEFAEGVFRLISEVETPENAPPGVYRLIFAKNITVAADVTRAIARKRYPVFAWERTAIETLHFDLSVVQKENGREISRESFENLSLNSNHRNYYAKDGVINEFSRFINVRTAAALPTDLSTGQPASAAIKDAGITGEASDVSLKKGILALEKPQEPAVLACPDALLLDQDGMVSVYKSMMTHCQQMRRFAVVDLPEMEDQDLLDFRGDNYDSTYAAAYAPFVEIINPRPNGRTRRLKVPPSGFVAGVFARTDQTRGVFKAPGNELVKGIVGLARDYTQRHQDALNPKSINLIRAFRGRGTRVWGARNLTTDTQWRYVNVRRLFLFIENSIDQGTQWVVFEPNNEITWMRTRVSVENFLFPIWRAGGLAGTSPEQAYRVRVGRGITMTDTEIDLGLMIIEVAIAPTKPAEFVVFRISHKQVTEQAA